MLGAALMLWPQHQRLKTGRGTQIPTYLATTLSSSSSLDIVGIMSAAPWAVCAVVGVAGGILTDYLAINLKWCVPCHLRTAPAVPRLGPSTVRLRRQSFRIRTTMHTLATLGPAISIALLPAVGSAWGAMLLLCTAMGCQAFNYCGFHAHIQDVASPYAGTVLSITNSCGIVMGIVGNILTGAFQHGGQRLFSQIHPLPYCRITPQDGAPNPSQASSWSVLGRST